MSQCTLNGKKNTKELCAIKMLAILRKSIDRALIYKSDTYLLLTENQSYVNHGSTGVSRWMRDKNKDPYFFNTQIPEHNMFPTKEEQEKIEKKVFTERRSQANRKNTKKRKRGL